MFNVVYHLDKEKYFKMEETLLSQFNKILDAENVTGCLLADSQGLCLLASPNLKPVSAGVVSAISQYAGQIDSGSSSPVIYLEGNTRQCLIHSEGEITTAIFKNKSINQNSQS